MASYPRYKAYPLTEPPPDFVNELSHVFASARKSIDTQALTKGLTSDSVLAVLREDLQALGFQVEQGKKQTQKIQRPVFFGEQGKPTLKYEIDAFHPEWRCGLEVEAGRAWMGNAVYRDLVQAMVMVQVDVLALAVPLKYKFKSGGRSSSSNDFENACSVADALYGHSRFKLPYSLILIGY